MDIKELLILCKRHFGNGDSGGQEDGQIERLKRREELLLLVPGLTVVAGHPEFAGGSGDLAVLWIGEIHADNVTRQRGVRLDRHNSYPMAAGVERMVKHCAGTSSPDF